MDATKFTFCIRISRFAAVGVGLLLSGWLVAAVAMSPNEVSRLDRPMRFEANLGQHGSNVSFVARGAAYFLSLTPARVQFELQRTLRDAADHEAFRVVHEGNRVQRARFSIQLLQANSQAQMSGQGEVAGRANYFIGNDPTRWHVNVPAFEQVRVSGVYPGIDLLHYGNSRQLEYDFELSPGASAEQIALRFDGIQALELSAAGELLIQVGDEELRQPKPVAYQTIAGTRKLVAVEYLIDAANTVRFKVGAYDTNRLLVIDPIMGYSSYFNAPGDDRAWAIAIGPGGDVYLAGETMSTIGLATPGAAQTNLAGISQGHGDVFVSRHVNSSALTDVYATYLGGLGHEVGFGLAVAPDGSALVTGYTASSDFPVQSAIQTNIAGPIPPGFPTAPLDCFITKIGPTGTNLVFSTYFGGSGAGVFGQGDDVGRGIALDSAGNIFVTGSTYSTNFPIVNGSQFTLGGLDDGFVVKLGPDGTNVIYSTYLGGSDHDYGRAIAVDSTGRPVVAGYTISQNFPVTAGALQPDINQSTNYFYYEDAFVTRLESGVGNLNYSSYLGGANYDRGLSVAVDKAGNMYVAGWTQSADFPMSSTNFGSTVQDNAAYPDAFVTKISASGSNYVYSAVFGGLFREVAWGLAVDDLGQAHVTGETSSLDFPTKAVTDLLCATNSGGADAFLAELNADGTGFVYSAYMGGGNTDRGYAVALDPAGNSYFTGETLFSTFPTTDNYLPRSDIDPFVVKLLAQPALSITRTNGEVLVTWPGYSPEFSLQTRTNLSGVGIWIPVGNALATYYSNGLHVVSLPNTNAAAYFRLIK